MQNLDTAIAKGIKAIGVGKRGSKSLTSELAKEILSELKEKNIPPVIKGAFFGALIIKGVAEQEQVLEQAFTPNTLKDPVRLTESLAGDAPQFVKDICARILKNKDLDKETAKQLGQFLFSHQSGDGARGMAASILRVRYETLAEYEGLLASMQETIERPFCDLVPDGEPIIQMAEPFDGVDHSNLITPLLAEYLQGLGYRVVSLVGRNSGPKRGNNLLDLAKALHTRLVKKNRELQGEKPTYGWYINQEDMSKAMDKWVEFRRQIIKRPFLATLERFVNPVKAQIIIASAFHLPYGAKMIKIAEQAGFPGIIIIRSGLEGTIAFALKRPVKILCSAKQKDGRYVREESVFNPEEYSGRWVAVEEKLQYPSLEKNAELIEAYKTHGQTKYELFDLRVKATCAGIKQTIGWIEKIESKK